MYILQRYIIRQHVGPFFFGFFVIVLIWILNLLFTRLGHLLSRGLSIFIIFEFFILNLAWIVALTVPMAVLMACLMAFGRLSSDYEITAMKSSGISLYRMIYPVLLVAVLLCIFLIWFNNEVLPDANHRLALLARDISRKRPTLSIEPGIIYREIQNIHLMVQQVKEQENLSYVKGVLIHDNRDSKNSKTIVAHHGEIYVDEKYGMLRLTLYDCETHEIPKDKLKDYRRSTFEKLVITIPIPDMVLQRSDSDSRGDREQSAQMMTAEIDSNKKIIKRKEAELNEYITNHIQDYFSYSKIYEKDNIQHENIPLIRKTSPDNNTLSRNIQKQLRINRRIAQRVSSNRQLHDYYLLRNSRLLVEVHKKYSIPFACIVFVLVGVPLAVISRRGGMAISGGISLIFFLIYWISLIGGEELADRRIISPFWAMWMANVIVGGLGIYLVIHTVREMPTFGFDTFKLIIPKRFRKS